MKASTRLVGSWGRPDPELTRVRQCRILERKAHSLSSSTSAEAFLRESQIVARITPVGGTDPDLDRILELLNRTNRLNWTRIRYASSWHVLEQDTNLVDGSKELAVNGLLFERPIDAFGHAVGLGLLDEAETRMDLPATNLFLEVRSDGY